MNISKFIPSLHSTAGENMQLKQGELAKTLFINDRILSVSKYYVVNNNYYPGCGPTYFASYQWWNIPSRPEFEEQRKVNYEANEDSLDYLSSSS